MTASDLYAQLRKCFREKADALKLVYPILDFRTYPLKLRTLDPHPVVWVEIQSQLNDLAFSYGAYRGREEIVFEGTTDGTLAYDLDRKGFILTYHGDDSGRFVSPSEAIDALIEPILNVLASL